jgi:large subunit ribosomal protein L23
MSSARKTVLLKQHITEKGTYIAQNRQYLFKVHRDATKSQIKRAVEADFKVKVVAINTVNMEGKMRRTGQAMGKRRDWKKAYVTLLDGYAINPPEQTVVGKE